MSTSEASFPEFSYRGVSSHLEVQDLTRIRVKYSTTNSFFLALLSNFIWAFFPYSKFDIFYKDTFKAGAGLPPHLLALDLLCYLRICPFQLAPKT